MKKLILILALMTVAILPAATLSGVIKDTKTKMPLEFANIAVYEKEMKTIKSGAMSDVNGIFRVFSLPAGDYCLVVSYMGYKQKKHDNIIINSKNVDIGNVFLTPAVLKMKNVMVKADKPPILYKIDKQIVDAKQFITASGGTAVDILENVPSVTVDIEGNVSLQNSSNITVMIDGRTSILDPQDALKTTPAESIENIEIMTNPSAKYDAEGGAGIINIVTRRHKLTGLAGLASIRGGTSGLNGSALVNYRNKKMAAYVSFNCRAGSSTSESYLDRYLYFSDTTANYRSKGIRDNSWNNPGLKGGLDLYISKNDILGLALRYSPRNANNSYIKDYSLRYTDPVTENLLDTLDYMHYENADNQGKNFSASADYSHTFPSKPSKNKAGSEHRASDTTATAHSFVKHQIKFAASYSKRNSENEAFSYLVDTYGDTTEGQWKSDRVPTQSIRSRLDYKYPINNSSHFEAGLKVNFNWKSDGNNVYEFNPVSGDFTVLDTFSNLTDYKQNTISAYSIYSAEFGKLGIQPGLRGEYTYREIQSDAFNDVYVIDSLHIFPTFHLSYQLCDLIQLMGSYTRRISRPPSYQLQPFYTWLDVYNIRIGNPALRPGITDSYQLSIQKRFGQNFVSFNTFYSHTSNRIEKIQTLYREGEDVILNTYENIGENRSLGLGAMSNLALLSWWRMNVSGNLYYYQISGELYGEDISTENVSYSARIQSSFVLPFKTRIQLNCAYISKSATAQGSNSGMFMSNIGIYQNFFKGKLSATLQVRDIFGSGCMQYRIYTPTTYTYYEYYREVPAFSLNLSLKINNYKRQRTVNNPGDDNFNSEDSSTY